MRVPLPSNGTLDAIRAHLLREAERGPMEAGMAARARPNGARPGGATVQCATGRDRAHRRHFGWGSAFAAFATAHPWQPGDRILVGRHEWGGNLPACG